MCGGEDRFTTVQKERETNERERRSEVDVGDGLTLLVSADIIHRVKCLRRHSFVQSYALTYAHAWYAFFDVKTGE